MIQYRYLLSSSVQTGPVTHVPFSFFTIRATIRPDLGADHVYFTTGTSSTSCVVISTWEIYQTTGQAPKSKRKRQYNNVGVMHTGQRLVLITASVIHRLQKICPHMLAVMSSHESAKHTRQCSGFGLTTGAVGISCGGDVTTVVSMLFG